MESVIRNFPKKKHLIKRLFCFLIVISTLGMMLASCGDKEDKPSKTFLDKQMKVYQKAKQTEDVVEQGAQRTRDEIDKQTGE